MQSVGKYLIAVIVTAAFTMAMTSTSLAASHNGWVSPLEKKFEAQHRKPSTAAHRIVDARKNRKNDFSNLNH